MDELLNEIKDLQQDFTDRVNLLRDKYFDNPNALIVILGNDTYEIGFAINQDAIKTPSLS